MNREIKFRAWGKREDKEKAFQERSNISGIGRQAVDAYIEREKRKETNG
jgi:hypothetical protein